MKTVLVGLSRLWRGLGRLPSDWLSGVLSKSTVTLNIEGGSIRVLTTARNRVTGWGRVPLAPGLVKDGLIVAPAQVGSLIETLLAEKSLPKRRVVASLAGMRSVPRLLSLPRITPALLQEAIRHESEREMPVPLDELYLCWRDLGMNGSERQSFVVGVPRPLFDAEVQALTHAGIKARVLDLKPVALARAVNRKEAVIIDLEPDTSDIVLVVEGVPVIMRTLIIGGEGVPEEDKVRQAAGELSRTLEFYNSSHPEHPISPATPAFVTGQLAKDETLTDLIRVAIPNPVEKLEPAIECPAELSVAEYAVNIGLALKGGAAGRSRRAAAFPAFDLAIGPDSYKARRPLMRSLLYALLPVVLAGLLFPAHQMKVAGEAEVARLEAELGTLSHQLQEVRQTSNSLDPIVAETSRLQSGRLAVLGDGGKFADMIERVFGGLPAGVGLTSVTMSADMAAVDGVATTSSSAIRYATLLEETGAFSTVHIASLRTADSSAGNRVITFSITANR